MANIKHIVVGWCRSLGLKATPKSVEMVSRERLKVCETCPFSTYSKVLEFINGDTEFVYSLYCAKCGCPVKQKSLDLKEQCPDKRWNH